MGKANPPKVSLGKTFGTAKANFTHSSHYLLHVLPDRHDTFYAVNHAEMPMESRR